MATLTATITCPECHAASKTTMAADVCQYVYECPACRVVLRPKAGDCCVICSYADKRCPWMQDGVPCPDADRLG